MTLDMQLHKTTKILPRQDTYLTLDFNQMSFNSQVSLNDNHLDMQYSDSFNFSDYNNFEFDTFHTKNRPRQPFTTNNPQFRKPFQQNYSQRTNQNQ